MKFLVKIKNPVTVSVLTGKNEALDFGTTFNEQRWWQFLKENEGKWLKIELQRRTRSLNQNAWLHGVIIPMIAGEMGENDLGYIKAILKSKFLSKEAVLAGKNNKWEKVIVSGRTSKLNTLKFGEFCEKIRQWAAMFLGLNIPDPTDKDMPIFIDED